MPQGIPLQKRHLCRHLLVHLVSGPTMMLLVGAPLSVGKVLLMMLMPAEAHRRAAVWMLFLPASRCGQIRFRTRGERSASISVLDCRLPHPNCWLVGDVVWASPLRPAHSSGSTAAVFPPSSSDWSYLDSAAAVLSPNLLQLPNSEARGCHSSRRIP